MSEPFDNHDEIRSEPRRNSTIRTAAVAATSALVATGVVLGAIGVLGVGSAAPNASGSDSASGLSSYDGPTSADRGVARPDGRGPGGQFRGLFGRVQHGLFVVTKKDGTGVENMAVQRGKVTAVTATSVTVRSDDGYAATYGVTADTKIHSATRKLADFVVGTAVGVVGLVDGSTTNARQLVDTSLLGKFGRGLDRRHGGAPDGPAPATSGSVA